VREKHSWVLLLPFLVFGIGVWLYFQTQNQVRVEMLRAQTQWRDQNYDTAIGLYESIYQVYPRSRYADDALFELGTISYVNLYDVNRALSYYQKLVKDHPQSALAKEAYLKIAEINEAELGDYESAIQFWKEVLNLDSSIRQRVRVCFRIASACLKTNRFEEALEYFEYLLEHGTEPHLLDQARISVGIIYQIKREYENSVTCFQQVLDTSSCADCRLQAQLSLIESYQFVDDLPKAIEIAGAINPNEYPESLKTDLLRRLRDKKRYYEPKVWTTGQ
jgi:pentatricopeptide repeat protein